MPIYEDDAVDDIDFVNDLLPETDFVEERVEDDDPETEEVIDIVENDVIEGNGEPPVENDAVGELDKDEVTEYEYVTEFEAVFVPLPLAAYQFALYGGIATARNHPINPTLVIVKKVRIFELY